MKANCIIVDDENPARLGLRALIGDVESLELIETCSNGLEAIDKINSLKPDLVFLDIQMPGVNGFEVIASLTKPRPYIIFTTAHDQYAIKAFELNAVDYLLKPFSDDRFLQATQKALKLINSDRSLADDSLQNLINHTTSKTGSSAKLVQDSANDETIVFKSGGKIHKVDIKELNFVEAYDYYVKVHFNNDFILIRESMKQMEENLPNEFIRIHKSYIINLNKVKEFGKFEEGMDQVLLRSGEFLKVSRSYKSQLVAALS